MHVTHVIRSAGLMGVEHYLAQVMAALSSREVGSDLVVLTANSDEADLPLVRFVQRQSLPVRTLRLPAYPAPQSIGRLARMLRQHQPDVIHLHYREPEALSLLAARRAGAPAVVASVYDVPAPGQSRWQRWLGGKVWARLDRVIAVNEAVQERVLRYGIGRDRVTVVPYGIDAEHCAVGRGARDVLRAELGLKPDATLITLICPLALHSGLTQVLEAMWHLSAQYPDLHLLLVGDGPAREELERLARGYRIAEQVHFGGWREDIHAVIAAADMLLLTCLAEDPTMLMLEAAALHTPVVALAHDGLKALLPDTDTGLLVSASANMEHLTSALSLLLEQPVTRHELAERAHQTLIARFPLETAVARMLDVYRAVAVAPAS